MSICLIDTSVFCNILQVPLMHQHYEEVMDQLEQYTRQRVSLILPIATIIETGNHIAQNGNGYERREAGLRFVEALEAAMRKEAPWSTPIFLDAEKLSACLNEFPDKAMAGLSLGDLSIIKEFDRLCEAALARRVFIWSLDQHLAAYDRPPVL